MNLLSTKLRREIGRKKEAFIAASVILFLGVGSFVGFHSAVLNLDSSRDEFYDRTHFADFTMSGGDVGAFARDAKKIDGVDAVVTRSTADISVWFDGGKTKVQGQVIGLPADDQPEVDRLFMEDGKYLDSSDTSGVVIEHHTAAAFDLGTGDGVELLGTGDVLQAKVRGIGASPEYLVPSASQQELVTAQGNFAVIFAIEEEAAKIAGAAGTWQALVLYRVDADSDELDAKLSKLASGHKADISAPQADQPSNAILEDELEGYFQASFVFPGLFLVTAALLTYVILTLMIRNQRAVLGMMLASGFSRPTMFGHLTSFGLVPAFTGALPGAVVGAIVGRSLTGRLATSVSIPTTVVDANLSVVALGIAFGFLVGLVSAAGPALVVLLLPPAQAMRGRFVAAGKRSLVERVAPPLRHIGPRAKMVLRNVGRNPSRTLLTMFGVALSLSVIIGPWGMINSVENMLDRADAVELDDARAAFAGRVEKKQLDELTAVNGVTAAEPLPAGNVILVNGRNRYSTQIEAFEPDTTMQVFKSPDGDRVELPERGVLLGEPLSTILDIEKGDTITIEVPGVGSFDEKVEGFTSDAVGNLAFTRIKTLEAGLGVGPSESPDGIFNLAAMRFDADADADEIRSKVTGLEGVVVYIAVRADLDTVRQFLPLFRAIVGAMLFFGAIMAFVMIFNAIIVNVSSRENEIAGLRAEGVSTATIARLVTWENLIAVALGIIPGILLGLAGTGALVTAYDSDLVDLVVHVNSSTYLYAIGLNLAVVALSLGVAFAIAKRIDLAGVLRESPR